MAKILLVAGHGAGDPGASGGGKNEATTMRQLVAKVASLIPELVDVYPASNDMFRDTNRGAGMRTTRYKEVIEFHMDASSNTTVRGGHVIIYKGYAPDSLDNRLRDVINKRVGIVNYLKPSGFSKRNNLLNLNVAAQRGISYRLLELGFISNANDREAITGKGLDETARLIAGAIKGSSITPSPPVIEDNKEVDEMAQKLGKTQQDDMRNLLTVAHSKGVFTKDHSGNVANMTRGEALDLLISYVARTSK